MQGIYSITHRESGRIYIGSSTRLEKRWNEHRRTLKRGVHCNKYLQSAWDKYGKDAFEFSLVEEVKDFDSLVEREQFWMDFYESSKRIKGFNHCPAAGSVAGRKLSPEHKAKVSAFFSGRSPSSEHRANLSIAHTGKKLSHEHIESIRNTLKGRQPTEEERRKMSEAQKGMRRRPWTQMTRERAIEIKELLAAGATRTQITEKFSVSQWAVANIEAGRTWKNA